MIETRITWPILYVNDNFRELIWFLHGIWILAWDILVPNTLLVSILRMIHEILPIYEILSIFENIALSYTHDRLYKRIYKGWWNHNASLHTLHWNRLLCMFARLKDWMIICRYHSSYLYYRLVHTSGMCVTLMRLSSYQFLHAVIFHDQNGTDKILSLKLCPCNGRIYNLISGCNDECNHQCHLRRFQNSISIYKAGTNLRPPNHWWNHENKNILRNKLIVYLSMLNHINLPS